MGASHSNYQDICTLNFQLMALFGGTLWGDGLLRESMSLELGSENLKTCPFPVHSLLCACDSRCEPSASAPDALLPSVPAMLAP